MCFLLIQAGKKALLLRSAECYWWPWSCAICHPWWQNKMNLPSLIRTPKSCQNLWRWRSHLTGVLAHGKGTYGYFDYVQWPHDSNLTITTLLLTLAQIAKDGPLPRKLLLQMDNCIRENKNKYVFEFLALLVEIGTFTEVLQNCSCRMKTIACMIMFWSPQSVIPNLSLLLL